MMGFLVSRLDAVREDAVPRGDVLDANRNRFDETAGPQG